MAKHIEKLGSFDTFTAPWETATGESEIDKGRLKRYLYGLLKDKAEAQDAKDETSEKLVAAEKDLTEAKAKGDPEGKIQSLEKERDDAKVESAKAKRELLVFKVGAEKGLTPKQAARLSGETEEELKADADDILETFGVKTTTEETDEEREEREEREAEEALNPRTTPRTKTGTNPADPAGGGGQEVDFDKAADQILGTAFRI